jgi:predicted RNase H-like nuclease
MRVVGVDACRGGWVAAVLADGELAATAAAGTLAQILSAYPDAAVIAVDMPLGLLERGWREADTLAAAALPGCRSRVFMVPPRAAWDAATYAEAVSVCRRLTDPPAGFSRQAWALKDKLRQANDAYAGLHQRLFEVHPEISFAGLNGGRPVVASKKTWNGQMARRALLAGAGIHLPDHLPQAGTAAADDVLDAAAAAWSAGRIAAGRAVSLPRPPGADGAGLPVAIWY